MDDLRYVPIEPNECPYCIGVKHWPWECHNQPEAREKMRKAMAEVIRKIAAARNQPNER